MGYPVYRELYPDSALLRAAEPHPFESMMESGVSEQVALGMVSAEEIQAVRPPLPPIPNPDAVRPPELTIYDRAHPTQHRGLPQVGGRTSQRLWPDWAGLTS